MNKYLENIKISSNLRDDDIQKLKQNLFSVKEYISPNFSRESIVNKSNVHLLGHIRSVFSEIVRVRYWHHIQEGKLSRLSDSAKCLLYSIFVALDDVHTLNASCSIDWNYVEDAIVNDCKYLLQAFAFLNKNSPTWFTQFRVLYGWFNAKRQKRAVYTLTR